MDDPETLFALSDQTTFGGDLTTISWEDKQLIHETCEEGDGFGEFGDLMTKSQMIHSWLISRF